MAHRLASFIGAAAIASAAQAALVTYDFAGFTNVGGATRTFTGVFQLEYPSVSSTVYFNGTNPLQVGFQSRYAGATRHLSIALDNNESVTAGPGQINTNNIQSAPPGSQVPAGLSLQAYTTGASGTINGQQIWNMYLAFLPVPSAFNWGPLNTFLGGNAQAMLQANPGLLPPGIDPSLTGTALPPDVLTVYSGGLFLGTMHASTTTVNQITSFTLRVPTPGTAGLLGVALAWGGGRRARRGAGDTRMSGVGTATAEGGAS